MRADLAGGRPNGGTFVPALYVAWFRINKLRKESGPVSERVSPLPPIMGTKAATSLLPVGWLSPKERARHCFQTVNSVVSFFGTATFCSFT